MTEPIDETPTLRERLATFFEHNGHSTLKETEHGHEIERPWSDPSFSLTVKGDAVELVEALNAVYLPQRFSAIWHRDSGDMECIWTPFSRPNEGDPRAFDFQFEGITYRCEWAPASKRLLTIGRAFNPGDPGPTQHRNLQAIMMYTGLEKYPSVLSRFGEPFSFWVRSINPWDEDRIVELARHMNFHMHYFDRATPRIVIHDAPSDGPQEIAVTFPTGKFPAIIAGRRLDAYLLSVWETSLAVDPLKRFLYSYQVLEFAGFYHLDDATHEGIRRTLLAPDAPSRLNEAIRQIVDAVMQVKLGEPQKLSNVVRQLVDPTRLWVHIEPNRDLLCAGATLDGGFELPPLVKPNETLEEFKSVGFPKIADHFRNIRNAIVHSRDAKQLASIAPTQRNSDRLRIWSTLVHAAAMEIMLYGDR